MPVRVDNKHRIRIHLQGAVQGVGFRPYIYQTAIAHNLTGHVKNQANGLYIEAEGSLAHLNAFLQKIHTEKPQHARIDHEEVFWLTAKGYTDFTILQSDTDQQPGTIILPDLATCPDCLREINDPKNRRYRYPFTNCTQCGPRFSIIESLPYDRATTTMKHFAMCPHCQREYDDPADRRFHAQPNACPACGPNLQYWDADGNVLADRKKALLKCARALQNGNIIAIKGLGGFHLMVDARNENAILHLRQRKNREEKPFAVMMPNLKMARTYCEINAAEAEVLQSSASPIVILKRTRALPVAPNNPYLGVMLPYAPLHHLLLNELRFPLIATSGNRSDEPICIDEYEALIRLKQIADGFLIHNRPIKRHVDDSIVRIIMGREMMLRRARGYAPLPFLLSCKMPPTLALGAHQKNTIALANGTNAFVSQHIGDLDASEACQAFDRVIQDFKKIYYIPKPNFVADLHPDYHSTQYTPPNLQVQHHHAHVAACMLENDLDGEVLGVAWDGTGYGTDETIWGGEFLHATREQFQRIAHLQPFQLPGGETAVKEPRRSAIGLLHKIYGIAWKKMDDLPPVKSFTPRERQTLHRMLEQGLNAPITTSAGRLFDAVSSLCNIRQFSRFEGQAAMELEFALLKQANSKPEITYQITDFPYDMIREVLHDAQTGLQPSEISLRFHRTLVKFILNIAQHTNLKQVVLTGGCFQNTYLLQHTIEKLKNEGFQVYWHQRIPPNDGGIALGQLTVANAQYIFLNNKK